VQKFNQGGSDQVATAAKKSNDLTEGKVDLSQPSFGGLLERTSRQRGKPGEKDLGAYAKMNQPEKE
jgi:hypothetical protein